MRRERGAAERSTVVRALILLALVAWAVWGLFGLADSEEPSLDPVGEEAATSEPGLQSSARPGEAAAVAPSGTAGAGSGAADAVTLTILDPTGRPASGVYVQWRQHGGRGGSTNADARGRAMLHGPDPTRTHRLQIMTWNLAGNVLLYDDNAWRPRDGTIRLERAHSIAGTVLDENGDPAAEFGVFYRAIDGDPEVHAAKVEDGGLFTIAPIAAGRYQVCAVFNDPWRPHAPPGFAAGEVADSVWAQTVDAGARDLLLRVRRGAVLRVQIEDWDVETMSWGHRLTLSDSTGRLYASELDARGRVAFCRLPAEGLYRLRLLGIPGGRYLDRADLATGTVVHRVTTQRGAVVQGHLALPADARIERVAVRAWPLAPGREKPVGATLYSFPVQGTVDGEAKRYRLQGLSPGRWYIRATTDVLREGVKTTLRATGRVNAGEHLDLTLRPE